MNLSRDQAKESLESIQQVMRETRRTVAHAGGGYYLIIGGVMWLIGFTAGQFLPSSQSQSVLTWIDILGIAAIIWVMRYFSQKVQSETFRSIAQLWLLLGAQIFIFMWILSPMDHNKQIFVVCTIPMMGYLIMGIWMDVRHLSLTGSFVLVMTILGYFVAPPYYSLWMAVLGGLTLIGSGVYVLRQWK